MRILLAGCLVCAVVACTDTLVGPFIEPTHVIQSQADLEAIGLSFEPGGALNPEGVCGKSYDREFAPWGEHYYAENWGVQTAPFLNQSRDVEAIIDVSTGEHDFGQVALAWRADGARIKLFISEGAAVPQLPRGCFAFAELEIDTTLPRRRLQPLRAPFSL